MDSSLIVHKDAVDAWRIEVVTSIDERIVFPEIPNNVKKLSLDFGSVNYINSVGFVLWLKWSRSIASNIEVELSRLGNAFVRLCNVSQDVIPAKATVRSFYLDYFCPSCYDTKGVLRDNQKMPSPEAQVNCEKCNLIMELETSVLACKIFYDHRPKGK